MIVLESVTAKGRVKSTEHANRINALEIFFTVQQREYLVNFTEVMFMSNVFIYVFGPSTTVSERRVGRMKSLCKEGWEDEFLIEGMGG